MAYMWQEVINLNSSKALEKIGKSMKDNTNGEKSSKLKIL